MQREPSAVIEWKDVMAMCKAALDDDRPDVAALFALCGGYGLRITDALQFRWRDLLDENGAVRETLEIKERKTGRRRVVRTPRWAREILEHYKASLGEDFDPDRKIASFGREHGWRLVKEYAERAGIKKSPVSPHSLRKSFCYEVYRRTRDPALTARITGHRSAEALLSYIAMLSPTAEAILAELCETPFAPEGSA